MIILDIIFDLDLYFKSSKDVFLYHGNIKMWYDIVIIEVNP